MAIQDIIKKVRSGVCKIEFYENGKIVNSGSGFICKNNIITNNHVLHPEGYIFSEDTAVNIIFGDGIRKECKFSDLVLVAGSVQEENDYAVLKNKAIDFSDKFSFDLDNSEKLEEGDEIILFGYPFETINMSSHIGRISSLISNNKSFKTIQLDASVNNGNSGGPLLNIETQKVVGIITRKQTGLAKQFDDLLKSFDKNIKLFESLKQNGLVQIKGVNPIEYMEISQNQMKIISVNIKRSANTGIGYAFSCDQLIKENFIDN